MEHTYGNGAVVAGSAGDEQQAAASVHLLQVVLNSSENDLVRVEVHAATHSVHHRVGLLENLLLHERREIACTHRHRNISERQ